MNLMRDSIYNSCNNPAIKILNRVPYKHMVMLNIYSGGNAIHYLLAVNGIIKQIYLIPIN